MMSDYMGMIIPHEARAQHVFVAWRQSNMLAALVHEDTYRVLIQISIKLID